MSSEILKAYGQVYTHAVGNLSNWDIKVMPYGAIVTTADVDNFTLVELDGFNADGERQCKQLADVTHKGYLIASVERRYFDESMTAFFNAVGERGRLVHIESGVTRFDVSAYELNAGGSGEGTAVTAVAVGMHAFFNPATKKFKVCNAGAEASLYATAVNKFVVVGAEADADYGFTVPTIKLEAL